jgi:hypothetical protein
VTIRTPTRRTIPRRTIHETEGTQEQHPGLLVEAATGAGAGDAGGAARSSRAATTSPSHQATLDLREVRPPRFVTLGQAPQSFLFGSVSGSWVAFALFAGLAVFVGVATTGILRRFAAPPDAVPHYGTTPVARRVIGGVIGGAVLAAVWWWLWSGFYLLEVGRDSVTLEYHGPPRQRVVAKGDIIAAHWDPGPKSMRVLVVETRSGKAYRSTQTSANDAFERRVTQAVTGGGDANR